MRRRWLIATFLAALVLVGGGAALLLGSRDHATTAAVPDVTPLVVAKPRPTTCEQLAPERQASLLAGSNAYAAALAAKGLSRVDVATPSIRARETQAQLEHDLGGAWPSWKPFALVYDGKRIRAIADDVYVTSMRHLAEEAEFVKDASGGLWRVVRAPRTRFIARYEVNACSWGCWGQPPPGAELPPLYTRDVWGLPNGLVYRGDVTIEYDAPTLDVQIIDQHCPMPS